MQGKRQSPKDSQILRNKLKISQMIMCQLKSFGQSISALQWSSYFRERGRVDYCVGWRKEP